MNVILLVKSLFPVSFELKLPLLILSQRPLIELGYWVNGIRMISLYLGGSLQKSNRDCNSEISGQLLPTRVKTLTFATFHLSGRKSIYSSVTEITSR